MVRGKEGGVQFRTVVVVVAVLGLLEHTHDPDEITHADAMA